MGKNVKIFTPPCDCHHSVIPEEEAFNNQEARTTRPVASRQLVSLPAWSLSQRLGNEKVMVAGMEVIHELSDMGLAHCGYWPQPPLGAQSANKTDQH